MLAIGAGGLDVALAMAGKPFKMTCPRVIGIRLTGALRPWVAAKDVILHVLSILGTKGNVGAAVEYFGPGVSTLSVPERATITNMGAELGVTSSVFPADDATRDFLRAQRRGDAWVALAADPAAEYDRVIDIDLGALAPLAACPSSPGNIVPVAEAGGMPVSQVVVGSCTNSSLKDMMMVAAVLAGRKVHADVSLAIAPGSRQVLEMLSRNGALADMVAAGCRILESACGPCIGQGFSPASGTVTVRTFNRNFLNRTGTRDDRCYLVSPETAVATALTGKLTDPRELGLPFPQWQAPDEFHLDDGMILLPPAPGVPVEIIRKETIGDPPRCTPLPEVIEGEIVIRVGDKITTDHIMPAGGYLKLRSNIPRYAEVVFDCFNEEGKPTFARRAAAQRDAGRAGVIVAGESYGQGSSREHAAICPLHLGIRLVLARSIERIHAANLINFGILPLLFSSVDDYERLEQGDVVRVENPRRQLAPGKPVRATWRKADGRSGDFELAHTLTREDIEVVLKGGQLA
jgi:aconitate hydratase